MNDALPIPEDLPPNPAQPTIFEMPEWAIEQQLPEKLQAMTDRASRVFDVAITLNRRGIFDEEQTRLACEIQNQATRVKSITQTAILTLQMCKLMPTSKPRALKLIQEAEQGLKELDQMLPSHWDQDVA
jgi:hypothetical protein